MDHLGAEAVSPGWRGGRTVLNLFRDTIFQALANREALVKRAIAVGAYNPGDGNDSGERQYRAPDDRELALPFRIDLIGAEC